MLAGLGKLRQSVCMSRTRKMSSDPSQAAALTVKLATEKSEQALPSRDAITRYLAAIGRQGGIKGGKARAAALSPERKTEIAQKAARARWNRGK